MKNEVGGERVRKYINKFLNWLEKYGFTFYDVLALLSIVLSIIAILNSLVWHIKL